MGSRLRASGNESQNTSGDLLTFVDNNQRENQTQVFLYYVEQTSLYSGKERLKSRWVSSVQSLPPPVVARACSVGLSLIHI